MIWARTNRFATSPVSPVFCLLRNWHALGRFPAWKDLRNEADFIDQAVAGFAQGVRQKKTIAG